MAMHAFGQVRYNPQSYAGWSDVLSAMNNPGTALYQWATGETPAATVYNVVTGTSAATPPSESAPASTFQPPPKSSLPPGAPTHPPTSNWSTYAAGGILALGVLVAVSIAVRRR